MVLNTNANSILDVRLLRVECVLLSDNCIVLRLYSAAAMSI